MRIASSPRRSTSVFALCLVLASGCDRYREAEGHGETLARPSTVTWEEYLARAERDGESYVVESDLWFPNEAALRAHYDQVFGAVVDKAHVRVQHSSQARLIWSPEAVIDIRYCVSEAQFDAVDTDYYQQAVDDMAVATAEWEALANIDFKYMPEEDADCDHENAAVDFAVIPRGGDAWHGCATAPFDNWVGVIPETHVGARCRLSFGPDEGKFVDHVLQINYGNLPDGPITAIGTLRHELGHVLGLQHEHPYYSNGCGEFPYQTGVNYDIGGQGLVDDIDSHDLDSVMQYSLDDCWFGLDEDYTFSVLDGVSVRRLYGMPVSWYVAAGVI